MYYLQLSDDPVRFDAVTQLTNVFFDNTNVQVFAIRSGGVTGVTVKGLDPNISTTFRMEDKGPVISIKFSPDHRVLAIQRSHSSVEFMNFKDLAPTTIEYTQNCKWKNASILGFVWSKANEIAFITDHGIELLQVLPERKQLKSLKTVAFSAAWFSHCAQSNIALLAGNNGAILQPFSLKNSTITKLPKLELEAGRPACERDVTMLRVCGTAWCSLLRHGGAGASIPHPAEVSLMPLSASASNYKHVLKTGLTGRFAVNVVDDLIVVHHQASKTSLLFDIMEDCKVDNGVVVHVPIANSKSMKPVTLPDQQCKMYSENWVVFQPNIIIDARLGCLWKVILSPMYLAQAVPPNEIHKIVGVLLRRSAGLAPLYNVLNDLISEGGNNLMELSNVFDEINSVYRKWAVMELVKCTGHNANQNAESILKMQTNQQKFQVVINQQDMYTNVLQIHTDSDCIVQVLTAYVASLSRHDITIQHPTAELLATALVRRGQAQRLRQMVRHGCLGDSRPLACLLLSLRNLDPAAGQLALDMLWRLKAYEETVEVLLGCHDPVAAAGTAKQAGPGTWNSLSARKLLAAALQEAREKNDPGTFTTIFHALENRNLQTKGVMNFAKSEQCESYIQEYRQLMADYL